MAGLCTYWHTLRHLKPVQLYGRAWFRLARPRVDSRPAPPLRVRSGEWVQPAARAPSMTGPQSFWFLNEPREFDTHGWDDPALPKLWRYNLHYFDDLNARDAPERREWHAALLERWVRENEPARGTGWEPYPTSLRLVNWVKWALRSNTLAAASRESLAVQARWLASRVETHLLGNHVFTNAKALVFAGLYFGGDEAARWLARGMCILRRQVPEQILPDGGHFERSTMYHALALEDMLDLCNIAHAYAADVAQWAGAVREWRERVPSMREWLAAMCHPDADISYFNDAASGIAPDPLELDRYAERLGFPPPQRSTAGVTSLAASGYVRVERDGAVALLDVAPIGPDYLPAHAHADTLSFEMSLFGRRFLVNSGTSCYGIGAERQRQRGTAAHNTVTVDGADSSEVWAGFRVGRRARPYGLHIDHGPTTLVRCSHDGYATGLRRREHTRSWQFAERALVIEDTVTESFRSAQARFHLHPSVLVLTTPAEAAAGGAAVLELGAGQRVRFETHGGALRIERSTWHPGFGRSEANVCLAVDFAGPRLRTCIDWGAPR